ncbi:MAG: hypothetical protein PHP02_02205 [Eubacteriales bacterium]|nr:hypothetical protein [Eubacteriales bacterium]
MKRVSSVLCLLLLLPLLGQASQVDLGQLSLTMPTSCDVFTLNMRTDDPLLALYNTSAEAAARDLEAQGFLMKAREISGAYTITLSLQADGGPDYAGMPDDGLLDESGRFTAEGAPEKVLRSRQAAFLVLRNGNTVTCVTRVGGALYRLTLQAAGSLTGQMVDTLIKTSQSMDFGQGQ